VAQARNGREAVEQCKPWAGQRAAIIQVFGT
jgi:hypothetical protein